MNFSPFPSMGAVLVLPAVEEWSTVFHRFMLLAVSQWPHLHFQGKRGKENIKNINIKPLKGIQKSGEKIAIGHTAG